MTTKIDMITSDVQTTFLSIPSVQTIDSSDNSNKLASIGFVNNQGINSTNYLDKTSTQTITGNYSITQPTITTIDRATPGILSCGEATNTLLTIEYVTLRIKTFLQNLSNYWVVGNVNTTTTTGVAVSCKKVQTGQVSIATVTSVPVIFIPPFVSKPVVLISVQSTGSTNFSVPQEWSENVTKDGFTASSQFSANTLVLNWMAIGT